MWTAGGGGSVLDCVRLSTPEQDCKNRMSGNECSGALDQGCRVPRAESSLGRVPSVGRGDLASHETGQEPGGDAKGFPEWLADAGSKRPWRRSHRGARDTPCFLFC